MIPANIKEALIKQHYALVGRHSAVKLCHWTKRSIRGEGHCYKQKFYGIQSHRCLQMSPAVVWCAHRCLFCWRNVEFTLGTKLEEWDEPEEIVEGCITAQKQLLSGYGGVLERIDAKKLEEAKSPNQAAISLAGEPCIYPELSELIRAFKRRGFTTFLVTNGAFPEKLSQLEEMPTQLYISLDAPNEEVYKQTCNPLLLDGWHRILESLELMSSLERTRRVVRLTLVKGLNMLDPEAYGKLIQLAEPDFVEVKAYMYLGSSRQRLSFEVMPSFEEVLSFARQLKEELNYYVKDHKEDSRVVLLGKE